MGMLAAIEQRPPLRIGLDFDNTLAGYNHVFSAIARNQGMVPSDFQGGKRAVKAALIEKGDEGQTLWMALQGQVYGRFMSAAELFPGAEAFLRLCRREGVEVFIVSHKSVHGHFDPDKVNLRDAATEWMRRHGFFDDDGFALSEKSIFFESTREDKVSRIADLNLDVFIDDLEEIFAAPAFPNTVRRVLYRPGGADTVSLDVDICQSWDEIIHAVFPDGAPPPSGLEIARALTREPVREIGEIQRGGNNRIWKVTTEASVYALKVYFSHVTDTRDRLGMESKALRFLKAAGERHVPGFCTVDPDVNAALYDWVEGNHVTDLIRSDIEDLCGFIARLKDYGRRDEAADFGLAAEACLSPVELLGQVEKRVQRLTDVACLDAELAVFLDAKLRPALEREECRLMAWAEKAKVSPDRDLDSALRVLSPSDLGFHNALRRSDGELIFLDFEYFGWDDPVKLLADTLLHPGMDLGGDGKALLRDRMKTLFGDSDPLFSSRFEASFRLYALRWCAIILNEFLPERWARREFAGVAAGRVARQGQLAKAQALFERVFETDKGAVDDR